jgi:hypothetical protein
VPLVAGGLAAPTYGAALDQIGGTQLLDLAALRAWLQTVRTPARPRRRSPTPRSASRRTGDRT